MKVAFATLGCRVNQYESEAMAEKFIREGYEVTEFSEIADVYVINTCTVTNMGDKKSRQIISRARRLNEKAIIAVVGCYSQMAPKEVSAIEGVDVVLGTRNKGDVVYYVNKARDEEKVQVHVEGVLKNNKFEELNIEEYQDKTRAFLKIQDGCNRFCSYCIIPKARGRISSKPLDEIVKEVTLLSQNGHSEIVLVGIDLSCYGKQFGKTLTDAVEAVAEIPTVKRIRLGSLEPEIISDQDIKRLSKIDKFCPQFHLSLQSGCDKTLKKMNRHYNSEEYKTIVKKIRSAFENATITTDVMVGFAGETDEDFNASLEFVKGIGFLKVHVFPYSIRKGTRAAEFSEQVDGQTKRHRAHIMLEETEKIRLQILNNQIGKQTEVLIESRTKGGRAFGYTKEYIPVFIKDCALCVGSICNVKIIGIFEDCCQAVFLD